MYVCCVGCDCHVVDVGCVGCGVFVLCCAMMCGVVLCCMVLCGGVACCRGLCYVGLCGDVM